MKNILYMSPSVSLFGARRALITLLRGLDRERFRPVAVCVEQGPLVDELEKIEVPVYTVPIRCWRKGKTWPLIPGALAKLARIIKKEQIDLIHANDFWANPWAKWPGWWTKTPVVCHVRNPLGKRRIRNYSLHKAAQIIAISKATYDEFIHFPDREDKVRLIYDGIDLSKFADGAATGDFRKEAGIAPDRVVVGMVGHLSTRKNQAMLLRAAARALRENEALYFILVGGTKEEAYEKKLRALVAKEGLEAHVNFFGFHEDMPAFNRAIDVSVLTSREEGLGLVSVEAMALGRPVIGTAVGGIPDVVVDGETGFLVGLDDDEQLAEKILLLAGDEALRRKMGAVGKARAHEKFSMEAHAENVMRLYDDILGGA